MVQRQNIWVKGFFITLKRVYNLKVFFLVFILAGIYVFILGDSGLLVRIDLEKESIRLKQKIRALKKENRQLINNYQFYRKGGLTEKDLLKAGFVKKSDKLIFLKGFREIRRSQPVIERGEAPYILSLENFRIIWVVFSILMVLLFFLLQAGRVED